jgi:hypothetical protein
MSDAKEPPMRWTLPIAAAALALAGAAQAQALDLRPLDHSAAPASAIPLSPLAGQSAKPMPDLADPLDPLAPTVFQSKTLESAVFAKTAVSRSFAKRDDLTGSVGFLCGLKPSAPGGGAAAAYGTDPHGRFVGAKFSIAFR